MIAVTLVLAVAIGSYTSGLGGAVQETGPSVVFSHTFVDIDVDADTTGNEDAIIITHEAGTSIPTDDLSVYITGFTFENGSTLTGRYTLADGVTWSQDPVNSGVSLTIDDDADLVDLEGNSITTSSCGGCDTLDLDLNGATISIVWESAIKPESRVIHEWTVPRRE